MSPASQRSIRGGTMSRLLSPPHDEPATRRPVIRKRGTTSSVSPLPATPATVHRPQPTRADPTARRTTPPRPGAPRPPGLLEDPLDGVGTAHPEVRRPLAAGQLQPLVGEVDGDDPLRAHQA